MPVLPPIVAQDGPWVGLMDSASPTTRRVGRYKRGVNLMLNDPLIGESVIGRPGFGAMGEIAAGITIVWAGEVSIPTGAKLIIAIGSDGSIYYFQWQLVGSVWAKAVDYVTQIAVVAGCANYYTGVIVSATDITQGIVINSCGTAVPFLWNGLIGGAAVITPMPNAVGFWGPPTMYAGHLIGIKASDRRTILWSQSDDPLTGYEAGGFTNAWTLTQTNPAELTAVRGSNAGLVVFRERSTTLLTGDPATDFVGANTEDSLDQTQGCTTPFGIAEFNDDFYFLNAEGQLHVLRAGSTRAVALWHGFKSTLTTNPQSVVSARATQVCIVPAMRLLFASHLTDDATVGVLVWDLHGEQAMEMATWDVQPTWMSAVTAYRQFPITSTQSPSQTLAIFGLESPAVDATHAWMLGMDATLASGLIDDAFRPAPAAAPHILELQPLDASNNHEKYFDRLDIAADATAQDLVVTLTTSRGVGASQLVSVTGQGTDEEHVAVGLDDMGRWARPMIVHGTRGQRFGIKSITLTAHAASDDPAVF